MVDLVFKPCACFFIAEVLFIIFELFKFHCSQDYAVSAPHKSYIHVDEFASAKELADYLYLLDKNDELYNSYFKWKGTGEFINTYFWCRVCAMLHDDEFVKRPGRCTIADINEWWRAPGVCTNGSWRHEYARKEVMSDD